MTVLNIYTGIQPCAINKYIVGLLFAFIFLSARQARADEFVSNGVPIHYSIAGKGEPVVLIHGLSANARVNWELPGTTETLAKHYEVISLDCRGHGKSGKPQSEDQYGLQMVEDVVRLMDHLHIAKAHVVGYSMGGMIVLKMLALHPDRVSTAILGGMGWLERGGRLEAIWASYNGGERNSVPPACHRALSRLSLTREEVKSIKVPVTVIVGEWDPVRWLYVKPLSAIRPDIPVLLVKNAGHLICVVMPQFKAELEAALSSK